MVKLAVNANLPLDVFVHLGIVVVADLVELDSFHCDYLVGLQIIAFIYFCEPATANQFQRLILLVDDRPSFFTVF
jgi:hypothetical protein